MNLTEKIGWTLTGLASLSSFIVSIFGGVPQEFQIPLAFLGIIIPIIVIVTHKIRYMKSEQQIDPSYFIHTKRDIVKTIENTISDKQPSYVIALEDLPLEKKEIIKAHFFTAEKFSKQYKGLSSNFNKILDIEKEFRVKAWKVLQFLKENQSNMYKIAEKNYSKNAKFDVVNFNKALGIKFDFELIRPEIITKVQRLLLVPNIDFSKEEQKSILLFNKIQIASADEHWACVKFYDYLIKEMPKLKKLVDEAHFSVNYKMQGEAFEYSQLIKNNFQAIKIGIPKIGVCKSCLDYFPTKDRKKMNKYLNQFYNEYPASI